MEDVSAISLPESPSPSPSPSPDVPEYSKQDTLCIPRMSTKIGQAEIKKILYAAKLGKVVEYKEILLRGDREFKRVLFTVEWNVKHPNIDLYRARIANNESIKLVYDFPWYWIIVKSNIMIWT